MTFPDHDQPLADDPDAGVAPPVCSRCGRALSSTAASDLGCLTCLLADGLDDGEGSADPPPSPLAAGERFGDFEVERTDDGSPRELGHGAMGTTYLARDTMLDRLVALKVIDATVAARSDAHARFRREARGAGALRHPNVASVFQYGVREADGQPYYAMEFIEGETLEQRVRRDGPLPPALALEIAAQIARALGAAEARGLVHRDLKPSNVMLTGGEDAARAGEPQVKVIDFGLAKTVLAAAGSTNPGASQTAGGFVGTPAFASPEQFAGTAADPGREGGNVPAGGGALDVRSDIFSLGVTLWYLLTGQVPFVGRTLAEIHERQTRHPLPVEQLAQAAVPAPVVALLRSLLAPDPAARPQNARALAAALRDCRQKLAVPGRRRAFLVIGAAAVLLAAAVAFIIPAGRTARPASSPPYAPGPVPEKSIAVLPFTNLGGDPANAFLADGMQDEILTDLARVADLKVISRTSTAVYRDAATRPKARDIGRDLGVAYLLEGTVAREAGRVRVTAQLIDTRTDTQVWAERYDRPVGSFFDLQDELSAAIAARLPIRLTPSEQSALNEPPTHDLAAYELFLRARVAMNAVAGDSPAMFGNVIALLEAAVARDPGFARAYAQLAYWHALTYFHHYDRTPARAAQARAAVEQADRARPGSAEAHLARAAYLYYFDCDYARAHDETAAALALSPNDAYALFFLGLIDRRQGRWDQALDSFRRAAALDPFNADTTYKIVETLRGLHRFADLRAEVARWTARDPQAKAARFAVLEARYDETGDVAPFREAVATLYPPGSDDADGIAALERFTLAQLDRDAPAAERALAGTTATRFRMEIQGQYWPRALLEADLAALRGEPDAARPALLAALPEAEAAAGVTPEDPPALLTLARLYARLGRREEALSAGHRALLAAGPERDGYKGPILANQFAAVLVLLNERDTALDLLRQIAPAPGGLYYGDLRRSPDWDALRGDPRFEALCRELAPAAK